jgi:uncharacterized membrane-anchored protein YitT (DUF2179 family)
MSMNRRVEQEQKASWLSLICDYGYLILGCIITALALQVFLIPNQLIDGGTVGLAMILSHLFGEEKFPLFSIIITMPFGLIAWKFIGKGFVLRMVIALLTFAAANHFLPDFVPKFTGDMLEVVVFGGLCLGAGSGLILRHGASIDGTEITALLINKYKGFTVGQVILFCNIFIFGLSGLVYNDWETALRSLMIYMVAYKVIDAVLVGFDEMKSLTIISPRSKELTQAILHELGVGVTVMYGRGGYSGEEREILYVIIERLQLIELKRIVLGIDPEAFIAIDNLHEIVTAHHSLD